MSLYRFEVCVYLCACTTRAATFLAHWPHSDLALTSRGAGWDACKGLAQLLVQGKNLVNLTVWYLYFSINKCLWSVYLFIYFSMLAENVVFFLNFILFLNFTNCISFAKYQNESATGIHVFNNLQKFDIIYNSKG